MVDELKAKYQEVRSLLDEYAGIVDRLRAADLSKATPEVQAEVSDYVGLEATILEKVNSILGSLEGSFDGELGLVPVPLIYGGVAAGAAIAGLAAYGWVEYAHSLVLGEVNRGKALEILVAHPEMKEAVRDTMTPSTKEGILPKQEAGLVELFITAGIIIGAAWGAVRVVQAIWKK